MKNQGKKEQGMEQTPDKKTNPIGFEHPKDEQDRDLESNESLQVDDEIRNPNFSREEIHQKEKTRRSA